MTSRSSIQLLLLLALALLASACGPDIAEDRDHFLTAEAALERGALDEFESVAESLKDYSLYPYLRYAKLFRDLGGADPTDIDRFLTEFGDTPLAERLRRAWLERLAKDRRWNLYLRFYVPDDSIRHRCDYLRALLSSGREADALDRVEPLWLRGSSLPNACDPVLDAWREAGRLTDNLVWRRVALAMDAGEVRLAGYLERFLPEDERTWVERWRLVQRDPRQVLDPEGFAEAHRYRPRILAYGIARLAQREPDLAAQAWDRLSAELDFPADQAERANAAVGLALAEGGDRRGLDYLGRIPIREDNLDLQERRLRTALRHGDWERVAAWISAMPEGQRKTDHWLYWQARSEEARGNSDPAQGLFQSAAADRSLWGFLAAEHVRLPYKLGSAPTPVDPQHLARMEQSGSAARIRELEVLGREPDIRREWQRLIRGMGKEDLMAAAVLAQRLGWPDRAIFTLAQTDYWDDLELRFPLLYRERVHDQAVATGLDESWIFAILRQESTFNPQAVSGSGATGLMQLLPATAGDVALSLGLPRPDRAQLYDPKLNITLGSTYLEQMRRHFGGNLVLATAAYNAGPDRVESWLPEQPMDADVWIATIPFRETRGYVRRVLAYCLIYDQRLGVPIKPLHRIMQPIGKQDRPPHS